MECNRRDLLARITIPLIVGAVVGSRVALGEGFSPQTMGEASLLGTRKPSLMSDQPRHPFDVALGQRLQKLREGRNLTQRELGDLLGVSQGSVSACESGKTKVAPRHLHLLCRLYNVSSDDLLGLSRPRQGKQ